MIATNLANILKTLPQGTSLVAVSKFHPLQSIMEAYQNGQMIFGESRPQEFHLKALQLPQDIQWHFIGHLQTNKIKKVLPFVSLIESVDSEHLISAINFWGAEHEKVTSVLLELHVALEETKQGFSSEEIEDMLSRAGEYPYVKFCGLMGMASNVDDEHRIDEDFASIRACFDRMRESHPEIESFRELSMGMSGDYLLALKYKPTYVRIGTAIFGERDYTQQ